jgi:predicted MFS family arabinose efflux permease
VIGDIAQGFSWLKRDRRAWVTISLMAVTTMVSQALILMFLVEAHSRQLSTIAIGVVLAASGVGGAVGSFCSRIVPSAMRGLWLPIQMIAWSVALAVLALAGGQSTYYSVAAMFILGLTGAIGNVEFGTYLVQNVADDMIAKITGIGQMLAIGACALGPVLGGYAVQQFGVQGAVWILLGIVMSLAFVSFLIPGAPPPVGFHCVQSSKPSSCGPVSPEAGQWGSSSIPAAAIPLPMNTVDHSRYSPAKP